MNACASSNPKDRARFRTSLYVRRASSILSWNQAPNITAGTSSARVHTSPP